MSTKNSASSQGSVSPSNKWNIFRKKPLWVINQQNDSLELQKSYDLLSLLCIGVGGTVGSGIFVLSGEIANSYAGPSSVISWVIAGFVCLLTALAYCELANRIPATGSTYSFSYHSFGELIGVISGWLLFLEYGMGSSAVARSWGDKVAFWFQSLGVAGCGDIGQACWVNSLGGTPVNIGALFIQLLCVLILCFRVDFSKNFINGLVIAKITLVIFVIVTGFVYFEKENLVPFVPPEQSGPKGSSFGINGMFQATAIAFFGFIGFDEVTCLNSEAINPKRDVPIAIIGTVIIITILYVLASLALVGMVPYQNINSEDGFYSAFKQRGAEWAADIVIVGEVFIVLPTVVLISLVPQTRLQYALSKDGMMPSIFAEVTSNGVLLKGTIISGVIFILISTFVPFAALNDLISAGILLSFILSNSSLLLLRADQRLKSIQEDVIDGNEGEEKQVNILYDVHPLVWIGAYNVAALAFAYSLLLSQIMALWILFALLILILFGIIYVLYFFKYTIPSQGKFFHVPMMPLIPSLAIFLNWILFAEIGLTGDASVLLIVILAIISYFAYGFRKSVGRRTQEWKPSLYNAIHQGTLESASDSDSIKGKDTLSNNLPQAETNEALALV